MEDLSWQSTIPSGSYSAGAATYNGPVTLSLTIDSNGPYYEGPDGTHGTDDTCDVSTLGDPFGVIGISAGTNSQTSTVYCQYTSGGYTRVDFDMEVSLEGDCDIDENGTDGSDMVSNSATAEERLATLGDCYPPFDPEDPGPPTYCDTEDDEYTATNL